MNADNLAKYALREGASEVHKLGDGISVVFEQYNDHADIVARLAFDVRAGQARITDLFHGPEQSYWARVCATKLERIARASLAA